MYDVKKCHIIPMSWAEIEFIQKNCQKFFTSPSVIGLLRFLWIFECHADEYFREKSVLVFIIWHLDNQDAVTLASQEKKWATY